MARPANMPLGEWRALLLAEARRRGALRRENPLGPSGLGPEALGTETSPERRLELARQGREAAGLGPGEGAPIGAQALEQSAANYIREAPVGEQVRANLLTALWTPAQIPAALKQVLPETLGGGGLTPDEEAQVRIRRGLGEAPGGGVAEASANLGMALGVGLPAAEGALAQTVSRLPLLNRGLGSAGRAIAAGTVGAAEGAAQPVLDDESRVANAMQSLAVSMGFQGLAEFALRAAANPVLRTEMAERLLSEGIVPQAGYAGRGALKMLTGMVDDVLSWIPAIGREEKIGQDVARNLARGAGLPAGTREAPVGSPEFLRATNEQLTRQYDNVWRDVTVQRPRGLDLTQRLRDAGVSVDRATANLLDKTEYVGGDIRNIREFIQGALWDPNVPNYLKQIDPQRPDSGILQRLLQGFERELPAERVPLLRQADEGWKMFNVLSETAAPKGARLGRGDAPPRMDVDALAERYRNRMSDVNWAQQADTPSGVLQSTQSVMPVQEHGAARAARDITTLGAFGAAAGWWNPAFAAGIVPGALDQMRWGSRYLLGDFPKQRTMADFLRRFRGGTIQAVLPEESEDY